MVNSFLLTMMALTYPLLTVNELVIYDPTLRITRDSTVLTRYNTELMYRMAPDELVDLADHLLPPTPILGVPPRGFSNQPKISLGGTHKNNNFQTIIINPRVRQKSEILTLRKLSNKRYLNRTWHVWHALAYSSENGRSWGIS